MKAINIKWDTDGDEELLKSLPQEIEITEGDIPEDVDRDDEEEITEFVSDYITDETGFCHDGFELINEEETENLIKTIKEDCKHWEQLNKEQFP